MAYWDLGSVYGSSKSRKTKRKTKGKTKRKTKKRAKKKAKKTLPVAKKKTVETAKKKEAAKKKGKKKTSRRAASCAPVGEPRVMLAPKRGKGAGKVKQSAKKAAVPSKCKTRKAPKPGRDESGWLYPACDNAEATLAQREQFESGLIPNAYPNGPYVPGSSPPTKRLSKSKEKIPERHGMPDLRWFVGQEAGPRAGKIIVAFSGGKDSLACLLYVIECCHSLGLDPAEVVECWHHSVDGRPWFFRGPGEPPGTNEFDWPVTEDYCRVVCACLGVPLYFSWRIGGLMGEVLKGGEDDPLLKTWPTDLKNLKVKQRRMFLERWGKDPVPGARLTAPMIIEMPDRRLVVAGGEGKKKGGEVMKYTRRSFPVPGGILSGRWCSSVAKIDVSRSQLRNRDDLRGKRTLVITGERAEESAARAAYFERELEKALGHAADGRHVERWRPVLKWCEIDVWAIIRRWKIRPHPAYQIGWGRLSCMTCIFGSNKMWASIKHIHPEKFQRFAEVEQMLMGEKQVLLQAAEDLPAPKRKKALKEAGSRIAWIDKDEPLITRVTPRWRKAKRFETKLYRDLAKSGALREFPHEVRVVGYTKTKKEPLIEVFDPAAPFKEVLMPKYRGLVRQALSHEYRLSPIMDPWRLPAGAFGESSGPT